MRLDVAGTDVAVTQREQSQSTFIKTPAAKIRYVPSQRILDDLDALSASTFSLLRRTERPRRHFELVPFQNRFHLFNGPVDFAPLLRSLLFPLPEVSVCSRGFSHPHSTISR